VACEVGSPKLARMMHKALAEAEAELDRSLDVLEGAS
jgi:hypothetical protein